MPGLIPDPPVVHQMREFNVAILAREHMQMQEMARQWLQVEAALYREIDALAKEAYDLAQAGKVLSRQKVMRLEHYKTLLMQTHEQNLLYADWAAGFTATGQSDIAGIGIDHAYQNIYTSYSGVVPYFDRLPIEATQFMVGLAGNGQTLGELLRDRMMIRPGHYGYDVWQRLVDTLVQSTALGINPRQTARAMQNDLTGGLNKAMTIARTEQLRVYRMTNAMTYERSGLVKYQKRICKHGGNVCIGCLADEGTKYPMNQPIPDHPNGHCTGVPVVEGMPEVDWTHGEDWLRTQDESVQRRILSGKRYDMWREGTQFNRFKVTTHSSEWGDSVNPRAIGDI